MLQHAVKGRLLSDGRRGGVGVGLVVEVVAVVLTGGRVVGKNVQFIHLWSGVHHHKLVLGNVCRGRCQVRDGLAFHALEVHVSTLAFLLFPGHADEGSLDVVVDDFRSTTGTLFHLLFVCWITYKCRFDIQKFCLLM